MLLLLCWGFKGLPMSTEVSFTSVEDEVITSFIAPLGFLAHVGLSF